MLFKFCLVFVFCLFDSLFLLADLELELGHATLKLKKLHVKGSLLAAERRNLLLQARVFGLLVSVVPFHLFLNFEIFVCKGFAHLLGLHGEDALKCILLGAQHLDLTLVEVELFSQLADHVL